jgi:hypothetical protein
MTTATMSPADALKVVSALLKGSRTTAPGFQDDALADAVEVLWRAGNLEAARKVARHLWGDGAPRPALIDEEIAQAASGERFPTAAAISKRKLRIIRLLAPGWGVAPEQLALIDAAVDG